MFDNRVTGNLDPRKMITSKIRLEDVEEKGFKALVGEKAQHVKILVDIGASLSVQEVRPSRVLFCPFLAISPECLLRSKL